MNPTQTAARAVAPGVVVLSLVVAFLAAGCEAPSAARAPCAEDSCAEPLAARTRAPAREVIPAPHDEARPLFDERAIRTYALTIAPEDLAKIDAHPSAEEKVPATLRFEGRTIANVTVRYKGSVGSFLAPCTKETRLGVEPGAKAGKCSLKLSFDDVDAGQRFFGLRKLNLHGMGRDPSMMREHLGYGLFRRAGVAASRTAYARVLINGQLEGLFLVVEQVDDVFVKARFAEGGRGNLYKEVWPSYARPEPYVAALETNKKSPDVSKMVAFAGALATTPDAAARWLDRDYMLAYLAVDRLIQNDDGIMHWYCNNGRSTTNHNYYWYEAEGSERLWLVPWDLDSSFANHTRVHVGVEWFREASCTCRVFEGAPQRAPSCDRLVKQLAAWHGDYAAELERLVTGPYASARIDERIDWLGWHLYDAIEEAAGVRGAPDPQTWEKAVDALRAVVDTSRDDRGYRYPPPPASATPASSSDAGAR